MNFVFAKQNDHVFWSFILTRSIWCSVWQLAWKWFVIHIFKVSSWTTGLLVWHSLILAKLARKWVVIIFVQNQNTIWQRSLVWHPLIQLYIAKLAIKWVVVLCVQNHNTIWHSFDSGLPDLVPQNLLGNGLLLFMSKTQHKMALPWFVTCGSSVAKLVRKWLFVIHVQTQHDMALPLIWHSLIKYGKTCEEMCFAIVVSKTTNTIWHSLDQQQVEQNLLGNSFDR